MFNSDEEEGCKYMFEAMRRRLQPKCIFDACLNQPNGAIRTRSSVKYRQREAG